MTLQVQYTITGSDETEAGADAVIARAKDVFTEAGFTVISVSVVGGNPADTSGDQQLSQSGRDAIDAATLMDTGTGDNGADTQEKPAAEQEPVAEKGPPDQATKTKPADDDDDEDPQHGGDDED